MIKDLKEKKDEIERPLLFKYPKYEKNYYSCLKLIIKEVAFLKLFTENEFFNLF